MAVRYSIDLPSPATLTLLPHARVISDGADEAEVVIVDWVFGELPE